MLEHHTQGAKVAGSLAAFPIPSQQPMADEIPSDSRCELEPTAHVMQPASHADVIGKANQLVQEVYNFEAAGCLVLRYWIHNPAELQLLAVQAIRAKLEEDPDAPVERDCAYLLGWLDNTLLCICHPEAKQALQESIKAARDLLVLLCTRGLTPKDLSGCKGIPSALRERFDGAFHDHPGSLDKMIAQLGTSMHQLLAPGVNFSRRPRKRCRREQVHPEIGKLNASVAPDTESIHMSLATVAEVLSRPLDVQWECYGHSWIDHQGQAIPTSKGSQCQQIDSYKGLLESLTFSLVDAVQEVRACAVAWATSETVELRKSVLMLGILFGPSILPALIGYLQLLQDLAPQSSGDCFEEVCVAIRRLHIFMPTCQGEDGSPTQLDLAVVQEIAQSMCNNPSPYFGDEAIDNETREVIASAIGWQ